MTTIDPFYALESCIEEARHGVIDTSEGSWLDHLVYDERSFIDALRRLAADPSDENAEAVRQVAYEDWRRPVRFRKAAIAKMAEAAD